MIKGSRTPGWNDPPTLSYSPLSASSGGGPGRSRINLNKRVAYPLQGTVTHSTTLTKPTAVVLPNQASAGIPPPPPPSTSSITQPVAVVHPMPHTTSEQENITLPSDAVTTSFRCLRGQVPLVQESINVRREEIERRLGIIEQLWQSGNLSPAVQQKIYRLSLAVTRRSYNEAMEIYTSLVANHANECTSWAVTLRHIVLTITTNAAATGSSEVMMNSNASTSINAPLTSIPGASSAIGSSNLVTTVPTMSVTAMPRSSTEESALSSSSNSSSTSSTSRVQHI